MPRLKRTRDEAELDIQIAPDVPPEQQELLTALRNMWEFSSFMQYLYLFGSAVKVDNDFDMEDFEAECLRPSPSERLAQIGLQLLKYVSSHRGLTPELFDEYTRRQYLAKAPHRNPFGDDEEPKKFHDLTIFTRVRVLHQLSTWTLGNVDRIRGVMPEDEDHTSWRIEPLGWDQDDRAYYVLDDNRLYRRADQPIPPPSPKRKAKSKIRSSKASRSRGTRASKRQKLEESADEEENDAEVDAAGDAVMGGADDAAAVDEPGYGFTSKTWECIAITLEEYQDVLATMRRSRDPNEKELRKRIEDEVLPLIERRAESLRQKQLKKMRELENLQKMATAKRSSRLAGKAEREKQEEAEREAEKKRQQELKMALEEQERQRKIEEGHESRRMTREQRVRERETKRILHQEELARIEEQATRASSQDPSSDTGGSKRVSDRQLKSQKEQHQIELDKLAEEEEDWIFDCAVCGVHGENLDDGTHSVACEKCNVWQHSKCHGFSPKQAESDGFHFICGTCKKKEEEAKKPKVAPLKLKNPQGSQSPDSKKNVKDAGAKDAKETPRPSALPDYVLRQLDHVAIPPPQPQSQPVNHYQSNFGSNGANHSNHAQSQPGQYRYPPVANFAPHPPQPSAQAWQVQQGSPPAASAPAPAAFPSPSLANGHGSPGHHQEQHRFAHQQALTAAGGHHSHPHPQYSSPAVNGYNPSAPHNAQFVAYSPPSSQHYQHQQSHNGYPSMQPPQFNGTQHRQSAEASSPKKAAARPLSARPPSSGQSSSMPTQSPPTFPAQGLGSPPGPHTGAHSPTKSSPPQRPAHQQVHLPPPSQSPNFFQTPQHMRPSSSSSSNGPDSTRHLSSQVNPSPPAANSNRVAAGGMSGPWPEASKAIPQKHDQSPAPPTTGQSIGENRVLPPMAPLVPNSSQQNIEYGPQTIPVKKSPGANGNA